MEKKFKLNLRRANIVQIGYIYKDIEKQAEIMEAMYNLPKFQYYRSVRTKIKFRGKDSSYLAHIARNKLFNIDIELIQWIEGDCPHKEFLEQGKEGLHHIAISPDDKESVIDDFKRKGIEVLMEWRLLELDGVYLDTEKSLGIILEIY